MYRVWCRFEPDHVYTITGRKGQWRVTCCVNEWGFPLVAGSICLEGAHTNAVDVFKDPFTKELAIRSTKRYPRGCIIRPHKELNRVIQQRKAGHAV